MLGNPPLLRKKKTMGNLVKSLTAGSLKEGPASSSGDHRDLTFGGKRNRGGGSKSRAIRKGKKRGDGF